jgi:broad specificity phosphatase PhoE
MPQIMFITHPDVQIDPRIPVPQWQLSSRGRQRMRALLALPWVQGVHAVWSSAERKAIDGADIMARELGIPRHVLAALGENDRTATGYLPKAEFEATADAFFAQPAASVRGWERAIDAQRRIVAAVAAVVAQSSIMRSSPGPWSAGQSRAQGAVAIVAHGGVGALLLCHLKGCAISRTEDQPGSSGGNYFCFDAVTSQLLHGWHPIDG